MSFGFAVHGSRMRVAAACISHRPRAHATAPAWSKRSLVLLLLHLVALIVAPSRGAAAAAALLVA
eukprot:scaffold35473_cov72-Phaeocystis_antarctica.AAC.1